MLNIYKTYRKEHPRVTNSLILASVSLVGCIVAVLLAPPTQSLIETLTVGTGYVGLGLLALTLLIGPINMLKVRKNPVNLNFRRDAGIWAGILSLAHVLLAFGLEINWGGTLLGYFFYKNGSPKLNLFGISNYLGLIAALILVFLMVLSNNHFLKSLKGKKWKNLQRFNYLLFALALGHTFTQQVNNARGLWMIAGVVLVTASVMIGQAVGFKIYRKREQERKPAPVAKPGSSRVAASTAPAARVAAPVKAVPVATGFTKLKIASAVSLIAMLGIGAGLEGLSLLNAPVTAQTGSLASDENTVPDTSTPAATTAAATTAAATTAAATATATAVPTVTATATATATAAPTKAATVTATPAPTATATATAATTVTKPSTSSGSAHTGGS